MNFVAIDFETANNNRTSACAVGLVKVENDEIIETFHSYIKPIPDDDGWMWEHHEEIHGITEDVVANKPTWDKIWPCIEHFFESGNVVCHNKSMDEAVFRAINKYYGICCADYIFLDTYKATKKKLVEACEEYGIEIGNHHNALADAQACAELALAISDGDFNPDLYPRGYNLPSIPKTPKPKNVKFTPLDDDKLTNKDTIFYHQKVVVTGKFDSISDRERLELQLRCLGADIKSKISRLTNIVVCGNEPGSAKMRQIEELNQKGCNIRVVHEDELIEILKSLDLFSVVASIDYLIADSDEEEWKELPKESASSIAWKIFAGIIAVAAVGTLVVCGIGMAFFFLPLLAGKFKR